MFKTDIEILKKGYKPLCYYKKKLLVYKEFSFYLMNLENLNLEYLVSLESTVLQKIISKSRLLVRLFRLEPRLGVQISHNEIIVSFKGRLYKIIIDKKKIKNIHKFRDGMSNPLNLTYINNIKNFDNQLCYGEYFSNLNKEKVNIYSYNLKTLTWKIKYSFEEGKINHIHSIIQDEYRNRVWILTGDFGNAAGIYYTEDDFKTVNKFLVGEQMYRACVFIPLKDGIIYATDSPDEENSINFISLENNEKRINQISKIEGSCIYGTQIKNDIIFSTAVEPSYKNKLNLLNLFSYKRGSGIKNWESSILLWNKEIGVKKILSVKKDFYPMGLFQFGTLTFPVSNLETDSIICYGNALKKLDGKLIRVFKK